MTYDAIVLGTGGVGSAALFHLAKAGLRVLGLDRFPPGHDRGSSHGESRVIRRSYFEHSNYVPLLNTAYQLWDELSELAGQSLLHRTGVLYFGDPNGVVVKGVLESARQHQLSVEQLSTAEAAKRFPMFVAPEGAAAIFEPDAGYLLVEECVKAHLRCAADHGAEHHFGETILKWSASDRSVQVETDRGTYVASKLVVAAGSWTGDLLRDLQLPLRIVRKHLHWHAINDDRYRASEGCPCYFIESQGGYFYGCPAIGRNGLKVAEHSGGTEIPDPLSDPNDPEPGDSARIRTFLSQHLPGISHQRLRHQRCFYTMTPDEHFMLDRHPQHSSVLLAAGLSGHGFKFTSALGKILADLVADKEPANDVNFLRLGRPGL